MQVSICEHYIGDTMNIFDILTLFGGLAMFLYGMRLMGDGLKEGSSGALKRALEGVTNNQFKAFLLGVMVTAIIQSSTATIVITSGLVAAGLLTLKQSLGIIIGANVGTTVTGQIIRLIGLDDSSTSWLSIFKPSTLAPVALIIGIVLIMGFSSVKGSKTIGSIAIGFGILFSGLLNMTNAVDSLGETGIFDAMFSKLGNNPFLGYVIGASVAFLLQSSSASIGILQAFSASGQLSWSAVYAVIVGIYLGDCVTTAIVCSIGAKAEQKRVGAVNIIFNLAKSLIVLVVVGILKKMGLLDWLWNAVATPGNIANTNTIFNLACAVALFGLLPLFQRISLKIIKDDPQDEFKYNDKVEALSSAFFSTPALARGSCYAGLLTMFIASKENLKKALVIVKNYDEKIYNEIAAEEDNIDKLTDSISRYLVELSSHLTAAEHVTILNQYYKLVVEFERLGDHAKNIADIARDTTEKEATFTDIAKKELDVIEELIFRVIENAEQAFKKRDVEAAYAIEPLEEVVDDMVAALRDNHTERLSKGLCNVISGTEFMDMLGDIERISDICSNIGLATVTRVNPELAENPHDYSTYLHSGEDTAFNERYEAAHKEYFDKLFAIDSDIQDIRVPD